MKTAQPSKIRDNRKPWVFNTIEKIHRLVAHTKPHEKKKKEHVMGLLREVELSIVDVEKQYVLFFEHALKEKLRKLFPRYKFLKRHPCIIEFTSTIKLLVDGEEAFGRFIENIEHARKKITIQMFIWKNDHIGKKIGKKLLEAANRGVHVTIYKDALGSIFEIGCPGGRGFLASKLSFLWTFLSKMLLLFYSESSHAKAPDFTISDKLLAHKNVHVVKDSFLKDHSKYFIIDDEILMTGGMNIGDEYYKHFPGKRARHDFMVEMKSQIVVEKFLRRLRGSRFDDFDYGSSVEFALNLHHEKGQQFEIAPKFDELLDLARSEIILEMAYFGDPGVTKKLIEVANRGVSVKVIIPKKSNLQDDLNKKIASVLLKETHNKIQVYLYPKPLHSKVVIVDHQYTFLGSANLNVGALRSLKETNILINDAHCQFTHDLQNTLVADLRESKRVRSADSLRYNPIVAFVEDIIGRLS